MASKNNAEDPNHDTSYVVHVGEEMGLPNMDFDDVMDLIQFFFNIKDVISYKFHAEIDDYDNIESCCENQNSYMFDICEDFFMEENSEEEPSIRKRLISSVALSNLLIFINMLLVGSRLSETLLHYFTQHFKLKSLRLHYHFCNN